MEVPSVSGDEPREKLTTTALEEVADSRAEFHLSERQRPTSL